MDCSGQHKKVAFAVVLGLCGVTIMGTCALVYMVTKKKRRMYSSPHHVWICSKLEDWQEIEQEFLTSCYKTKIIGLDCEWTMENNKPRPVALLQLSTADGACVLLRLNKFEKPLPLLLLDMLQDSSFLKLGVAIQQDAQKLLKDHDIVVRGCLDLRHIVDFIRSTRVLFIEKSGLQELAKSVVGVTLDKSFRIRCSNWDAEDLTPAQIKYAATDANIAVHIFIALMNSHRHWYICWKELTLTEVYTMAMSLYGHLLDVTYRQKAASPSKNLSLSEPKLTSDGTFLKGYSIRKTPLYHNCLLQAPDGELLCTCDIKKLQWYLDKGLGEVVQQEPFTVRLFFEPSGRPTLDNMYYTTHKMNICVVCGKTESMIRKVVVPHEYRKHFPKLMTDRLSHDILLLCVRCHQRSNAYDTMMRQQLAHEYNAPIGAEELLKAKEDASLKKVKSAGRALRFSRDVIPEPRMKFLEQLIKDYYNVPTLTEEVLTMAANMETVIPNENYVSHGLKVVQQVSKQGGLLAFEKRWRQHFLDTMKPMHLPEMWSVDHNHERLAQQISQLGDPGFDVNILGLPKEIVKKLQ